MHSCHACCTAGYQRGEGADGSRGWARRSACAARRRFSNGQTGECPVIISWGNLHGITFAAQLPSLILVWSTFGCQLSRWQHVKSVDNCSECRQLTPGVLGCSLPWQDSTLSGIATAWSGRIDSIRQIEAYLSTYWRSLSAAPPQRSASA